MPRSVALVGAVVLAAVSAPAQCFTASGVSHVPNMFGTGAAMAPLDDEGLSTAPVALGFNFPMPGIPDQTHIVVGTNGEIYLTTGGPAVDPYNFGIDTLAELRGAVGASPRIVAWGHDLADVGPSQWDILLDQTATSCKVTWENVGLWTTPSQEYSFSVTLRDNGAIECAYGAAGWPGVLSALALIGVSIGNNVGTGSEPVVDLSVPQNSGTLGLLYEVFPANSPTNDLAGTGVAFAPNGLGGYSSAPFSCTAAYHAVYGAGCYTIPCFVPTGVSHAPAMVQLGGIPLNDEGVSAAAVPLGFNFPMPGIPDRTHIWVRTNGDIYLTTGGPIVDGAAFGVRTLGELRSIPGGSPRIVPWGGDLGTAGPLPWDIKLDQSATSCKVTWQNVGYFLSSDDYSFSVTLHDSGLIEFSWSAAGWPASNPENELIGVSIGNAVGTVAEPSLDFSAARQTSGSLGLIYELFPSGSTNDLAGKTMSLLPNGFGGYSTLITCDGNQTTPPVLTASPAPVFALRGSSVPMTWQMANLRDLAPAAPGVYLALLMFSVNPPIGGTGVDMSVLGLDAPGCTLLIGSLDVPIGVSGVSSSIGQPLTFGQPLAPGDVFYSQVANFIVPNSLPNGQNGFGLILSNGLASEFNLF
jgi:hypothetical protein